MSDISRNDEWNSDRPRDEERKYDGPAGMDPDGVIDSNWEEVCENFDDMNLREELLRGIYAYGFEKPSAIQQRAIVPCIKVSTLLKLILNILLTEIFSRAWM